MALRSVGGASSDSEEPGLTRTWDSEATDLYQKPGHATRGKASPRSASPAAPPKPSSISTRPENQCPLLFAPSVSPRRSRWRRSRPRRAADRRPRRRADPGPRKQGTSSSAAPGPSQRLRRRPRDRRHLAQIADEPLSFRQVAGRTSLFADDQGEQVMFDRRVAVRHDAPRSSIHDQVPGAITSNSAGRDLRLLEGHGALRRAGQRHDSPRASSPRRSTSSKTGSSPPRPR